MFDDAAAASDVTNIDARPGDALTGQIPKDPGRDRPYEVPLSGAWLVFELDQARAAFLQLDA